MEMWPTGSMWRELLICGHLISSLLLLIAYQNEDRAQCVDDPRNVEIKE